MVELRSTKKLFFFAAKKVTTKCETNTDADKALLSVKGVEVEIKVAVQLEFVAALKHERVLGTSELFVFLKRSKVHSTHVHTYKVLSTTHSTHVHTQF
jgi:hypothetical protein